MISFEKFVRDLQVKHKILFIVIASIVLSLITAFFLIAVYDRQSFRQGMVEELTVLSDVIAKRSSAALLFQDTSAATANLESLSVKDNIILACIYDANKKPFAIFSRSRQENEVCPELPYAGEEVYTLIKSGISLLVNPIEFSGRKLGWIYVAASMDKLADRMNQLLIIGALIFLTAGVVAYLFAVRVQRYITQPLVNLQLVLRTITKSRDYSLRAIKESDDEFGHLVVDFNRMLHMVQEANLRLSDAVEEIKSQKEISDNKAVGAEERTQAIKEFFSGVSHDLKQPLSAINLFLGVLQNEKKEEKKQVYIEKILESSNNLNSLFDGLLDMNRIDQIMNNVNKTEINLQELVDNIFSDFEVMAADKGLRLKSHIPDIVVFSDATMLERVLRNLLANAVRYTQNGGILIAAREKSGQVYVEVWDTGVGIPQEKLESVFERYTQLDNPNNEAINGFGLGLSIVSRLLSALGHKLELYSRVGRGTVFKVVIPSVKKAIRAVDVVDRLQSSLPFYGKYAIIIDDEKNIAEAMLATAMAWDINAEAATSIESLKVLLGTLERAPDIVLTDYTLSETETGLMALDMIEEYFDKPVSAIVITGEKDQEILDQIKFYGCHYLPKPVDLQILKEKVDLVLNNKPYES